jgi:hypothetical protein
LNFRDTINLTGTFGPQGFGATMTVVTDNERLALHTHATISPAALFAAEVVFLDLSADTPSNILTAHFSSSNEVVIQHTPILCPYPHTSRLTGLNTVRSYFDLIATAWLRSDMTVHMRTVVEPNQVAVSASVQRTWR